MDGGHKTLNETPVVVDDLGERSQAVGGARSVGNNGVFALVGLVVDTHDEHLDTLAKITRTREKKTDRSICGRSRDDDLLGATLQVGRGLLGGGEDTGGLDNVSGAGLGPLDVGGITLLVELDALAVDDEVATVDLDGTLELTVLGVILEHVGL